MAIARLRLDIEGNLESLFSDCTPNTSVDVDGLLARWDGAPGYEVLAELLDRGFVVDRGGWIGFPHGTQLWLREGEPEPDRRYVLLKEDQDGKVVDGDINPAFVGEPTSVVWAMVAEQGLVRVVAMVTVPENLQEATFHTYLLALVEPIDRVTGDEATVEFDGVGTEKSAEVSTTELDPAANAGPPPADVPRLEAVHVEDEGTYYRWTDPTTGTVLYGSATNQLDLSASWRPVLAKVKALVDDDPTIAHCVRLAEVEVGPYTPGGRAGFLRELDKLIQPTE